MSYGNRHNRRNNSNEALVYGLIGVGATAFIGLHIWGFVAGWMEWSWWTLAILAITGGIAYYCFINEVEWMIGLPFVYFFLSNWWGPGVVTIITVLLSVIAGVVYLLSSWYNSYARGQEKPKSFGEWFKDIWGLILMILNIVLWPLAGLAGGILFTSILGWASGWSVLASLGTGTPMLIGFIAGGVIGLILVWAIKKNPLHLIWPVVLIALFFIGKTVFPDVKAAIMEEGNNLVTVAQVEAQYQIEFQAWKTCKDSIFSWFCGNEPNRDSIRTQLEQATPTPAPTTPQPTTQPGVLTPTPGTTNTQTPEWQPPDSEVETQNPNPVPREIP
jgi:hypothetical protein